MNNKPINDNYANLDVFNIHKNINPAEVLEFIKNNFPISIWDLCKKLTLNRNTAYYLLRDFERAGLIFSKIIVNDENRNLRMVYYGKKQKGKNEN